MKKLIVFMLTLVLVGSPVASSAAAPKPGTSCSKIGAKVTASNKVFTCTKSGNKRVWSKGVAVTPKAAPALTWQNAAANASRLNESVWLEAVKYKSTPSRQVVADRAVASSPKAYFGATNFNAVLNDSESFFSWAVLPSSYKVLHHSTNEMAWADEKFFEWSGNRDQNVGTGPGGRVWKTTGGQLYMAINLDLAKPELRPTGDDYKHILAHEFAHVVQYSQSEKILKSSPWLIEGGANFFAALITSKNKSEFDTARSGARGASRPWKEGLLGQLSRTSGGATGDDYNMGFYATQALAGIYGIKKVVEFYKSTSENPNFSEAFFNHFGEKWDYVKPHLVDTMIALSKVPW